VRSLIFHSLKWFTAAALMAGNLSAFADEADPKWPAVGITETSDTPGEPDIQIVTVDVPQKDEAKFVTELVQQNPGSDPLLIVYRKGDALSGQLDSLPTNNPNLVTHQLELNETVDDRVMPITMDGLTKAGKFISISSGGMTSTMFYMTSDVGSATAATLFIAFMQWFNMHYPGKIAALYNKVGDKYQTAVQNTFPKSKFGPEVGYAVGRMSANFVYNFLSNSVYRLAINLGNVSATFGSAAAMASIATTATMNVFASGTWDLFLKRVDKKTDDPEIKKTVKFAQYGKTAMLLSMTPFMFIPETRDAALAVMFSFGALGVYANFYGQPFINAAQKLMSKMEHSKRVSQVVTHVLNAQAKVKNLFHVASAKRLWEAALTHVPKRAPL
jgi:hypothetical protein